jgi:hypothetical protein
VVPAAPPRRRGKVSMPTSGWLRVLICIFAVALVVRVVFVLMLQDGFYFPDWINYSRAAESLITKGELGETYRRPPVCPFFLAGIYTFSDSRSLRSAC